MAPIPVPDIQPADFYDSNSPRNHAVLTLEPIPVPNETIPVAQLLVLACPALLWRLSVRRNIHTVQDLGPGARNLGQLERMLPLLVCICVLRFHGLIYSDRCD